MDLLLKTLKVNQIENTIGLIKELKYTFGRKYQVYGE